MTTQKFDATRLVAQSIIKNFANAREYTEHAITSVKTDGDEWTLAYDFPLSYIVANPDGPSEHVKSVQRVIIKLHSIEVSRESN